MMTYEIEINDYGINDEDALLELPGKAWILMSVEEGLSFFDGFKIDFLNADTSMMLVLHYAHKYNADRVFRKAVNKKIEDFENKIKEITKEALDDLSNG